MQGAIGISMNSKRRIPYGNIVWRGKKKRNNIKQTNFPQTQKAKVSEQAELTSHHQQHKQHMSLLVQIHPRSILPNYISSLNFEDKMKSLNIGEKCRETYIDTSSCWVFLHLLSKLILSNAADVTSSTRNLEHPLQEPQNWWVLDHRSLAKTKDTLMCKTNLGNFDWILCSTWK